MPIELYNSLTRQKEKLPDPAKQDHIKMYVCGPTVYDRPHLGNARSVVIYDVLYRLLKSQYPKVTYVRNITDVDDKINKAAKENGETIKQLTTRVTDLFHADMDALNCLRPDKEPRATDNIKNIVTMIERLIKNGNAYAAEGHVLFDVTKYKDYGKLSNRSLDDMIAGNRVEVAPYKKNPGDFVLWKPADDEDDESSKFESPWGIGRPGWHIECSAMATAELGRDFYIHGGGADLMFPHHENEIAQSCCANPGSHYAKTWVHNGFLTVNGEKMSKSLGNFTTVRDLLDKGVKGEVIRYALLSSNYRGPLDWNEKLLSDSQKAISKFYHSLQLPFKANESEDNIEENRKEALSILGEDLNISKLFSKLHGMTSYPKSLKAMANIIGLLQDDVPDSSSIIIDPTYMIHAEIETLANQIQEARKTKDYPASDKIKAKIIEMGYNVSIDKEGKVTVTKK